MTTREKFLCVSVMQRCRNYGEPVSEFVYDAEFYPVQNSAKASDEDLSPSGSIKMGTIKSDHFHFIPGKTYYVDFTETVKRSE